MRPYDRQEKIRRFIEQHKKLSIEKLSEQFQVSKMTIYRDIHPLVKEGLIVRKSGIISLVTDNPSPSSNIHECVYCHKPINPRLLYRLVLSNNKIETTCCAHCGLLRHHQLGEAVSHALCHDFLLGTTVSAFSVWYVMDTTLNIPCCQPQVLTFEEQNNAENFVQGFGGEIYTFQDAFETVYQRMHGREACANHMDNP